MGHILGAHHDLNSRCVCGGPTVTRSYKVLSFNFNVSQEQCLMYPNTRYDYSPPHLWSNCSLADVQQTLGSATCLHKPDTKQMSPDLTICGNGLVEAGEQCDCNHSDLDCRYCCLMTNCTHDTDPDCVTWRAGGPLVKRRVKTTTEAPWTKAVRTVDNSKRNSTWQVLLVASIFAASAVGVVGVSWVARKMLRERQTTSRQCLTRL